MTDAKREADELRLEIGKLDAQLLVTLEKRARAARRMGELRKDQPAALPIGDRATLSALVARATGEMPPDALRNILREVFAACTALELPVKVAYTGPEGGPGHAAARLRFGGSSNLFSTESTAAALEEVTRKRAEFAVVPFETRADGPVQPTIAALTTSELRLCEQLDTEWNLDLMNKTGNAGDVEKIYATPADHLLCQRFLSQLTGKSILDVRSPLMACELAADDHGAAALTTEVFGAELGLVAARKNVLDHGSDRVRYAVVGTRPSSRTGNDVTAVVFSVQDAPGSLLDVLKQFSERGVNLSKIESRPVPGESWSYLFFVEVAGHFTDRAVVASFEDVKRLTRFFKVLGSYPALPA